MEAGLPLYLPGMGVRQLSPLRFLLMICSVIDCCLIPVLKWAQEPRTECLDSGLALAIQHVVLIGFKDTLENEADHNILGRVTLSLAGSAPYLAGPGC